jgi:hypothetical protein
MSVRALTVLKRVYALSVLPRSLGFMVPRWSAVLSRPE